MCAYWSGQYASSMEEFGRPRRLERAGGWVLERPIPGSDDVDAMGFYPLFACRRWDRLGDDLAGLGDLVSLVLVADPFGDHDPGTLGALFNRGAVPFKRHHVVGLGPPVEALASPHHRRNARKALGSMDIERVEAPSSRLDDWVGLYEVLVRRHEIRGVAAFSGRSFARQLAGPGLVAFRAEAGGSTIGMVLWVVQGEVAYYHLGAYDEAGYLRNASFALFWRAIEWFTSRVRWLDLGAGAGLAETSNGLDRFKAGWATGTRTAYLCRHVFRPDRYEAIARASGSPDAAYFPSYRAGEFAQEPGHPAGIFRHDLATGSPPTQPSPTRGEGSIPAPASTEGEGSILTPSPLVGEGWGGGMDGPESGDKPGRLLGPASRGWAP